MNFWSDWPHSYPHRARIRSDTTAFWHRVQAGEVGSSPPRQIGRPASPGCAGGPVIFWQPRSNRPRCESRLQGISRAMGFIARRVGRTLHTPPGSSSGGRERCGSTLDTSRKGIRAAASHSLGRTASTCFRDRRALLPQMWRKDESDLGDHRPDRGRSDPAVPCAPVARPTAGDLSRRSRRRGRIIRRDSRVRLRSVSVIQGLREQRLRI